MEGTENKFRTWLYGLPVASYREAKKKLVEEVEIPYSTLYYMLKDDYSFTRMQQLALNEFAYEFNKTRIF